MRFIAGLALIVLLLSAFAHAIEDQGTQKAKMILSLRRFVYDFSAQCPTAKACESVGLDYIKNFIEDQPSQNWGDTAPKINRLHQFGLVETMCTNFDAESAPDAWLSRRIRCFRSAVKALNKDVIGKACEPDLYAKSGKARDDYGALKLKNMNQEYYAMKEDIANCYSDQFEYFRNWIQKLIHKGLPLKDPPMLPKSEQHEAAIRKIAIKMKADEGNGDETDRQLKSAIKQATRLKEQVLSQLSGNKSCMTHPHRLPGLTDAFDSKGADCTPFIKDDGTYGWWGKVLESELNSGRYPRFTHLPPAPRDIARICPNYSRLQLRERKHFWIWVFASIAHDESTCSTHAKAQGTNDKAVGLLQMEKTYRKRFWRGKECQAKDMTAASPNLKCGMRILHEQLLGKSGDYQSSGRLYPGEPSYWEKLNSREDYPTGGTIGHLIRTFPLCH